MAHLAHAMLATFSSTVSGRKIVQVTCERCQCVFYFEMHRTASGSSTTVRFIGERAATNRARRSAEKKLARRFARETELVACPDCNWVNESLIRSFRRGLFKRAPWLVGGLLLVIYGICCLANAVNYTSSYDDRTPVVPTTVVHALLAISVGSLVGALILREWRRRQIDPNATYPNPPRLPHGSPPALFAREDVAGTIYSRAVPQEDENYLPGEWIYFHSGQLRFPQVCCLCGAPPTTVYSKRFKLSPSDLAVPLPLCAACKSRVRGKWWLAALKTVAASVALCWGATAFMRGLDDFTRRTIFAIASFTTSLIAVCIVPNRIAAPYRLRVVNRGRGIYRIRTRNPEFDRQMLMSTRIQETKLWAPAGEVVIRK